MVAFSGHAPPLQVLVTHPPIQPVCLSVSQPQPRHSANQVEPGHCQRFLLLPVPLMLIHRWTGTRVRVDQKWLPRSWRWLLAISSNPSVARKSCGRGFQSRLVPVSWWFIGPWWLWVYPARRHISFAPVSCWTVTILAYNPVEQNFRCVRNLLSNLQCILFRLERACGDHLLVSI